MAARAAVTDSAAPAGRHDARRRAVRRRLIAASGIVIVIAAGLLVHLALPDSEATDIAGDGLYAAAAYLFVVVVAPRWHPAGAALVAGAWCVAVELFQLTGLPEQWGAAFSPIMLVLGTVFDARDLWVYLASVAVLAGVDLMGRAVRRR